MAKQVLIERGLPFSAKLPEPAISRTETWNAFEELRKQAADVPEMSLDEINAEISAVRAKSGFYRHARANDFYP